MGPRQRQEGSKEGAEQAGRRNGIFGISHTDGQIDRQTEERSNGETQRGTDSQGENSQKRSNTRTLTLIQTRLHLYVCMCVCIGAESNTEIQSEGQRTTDVGNVLDDGQPQS